MKMINFQKFLLCFYYFFEFVDSVLQHMCVYVVAFPQVLVEFWCVYSAVVFFYLISKETTMYGDELHLNKVRTTHSFSLSLSLTHFQLNTCVLN